MVAGACAALAHHCPAHHHGTSLVVVPNIVPSFVDYGSSWGPSISVLAALLIFSSSLYGLSEDNASSSLLQVAFDFLFFFLGFCHM